MATTIRIEGFNPQATADRIINNDRVGLHMAETCAKFMAQYIPFDSGMLSQNYLTRPFEVEYTAPYAHYQWEGEVYGDNFPIIVGGVVTGWYSRKNVQKHPTGKKLNYTNPNATAHWDKTTQELQGDAIAYTMTEYLK